VLADLLDPGSGRVEPGIAEQTDIVRQHYDAMLDHYGEPHGIKIARKHVGWAIDRWRDAGLIETEQARIWRTKLLRSPDAGQVRSGLDRLSKILSSASEQVAA
jgi:tRNA-dihydrouridine synthase B